MPEFPLIFLCQCSSELSLFSQCLNPLKCSRWRTVKVDLTMRFWRMTSSLWHHWGDLAVQAPSMPQSTGSGKPRRNMWLTKTRTDLPSGFMELSLGSKNHRLWNWSALTSRIIQDVLSFLYFFLFIHLQVCWVWLIRFLSYGMVWYDLQPLHSPD